MMPLFANELLLFKAYLPYIVGCGVAVALSSAVFFYVRRPRGLALPPIPKLVDALPQEDDETYANRRSSNRRDGTPVPVILSSPAFRGQMETGWVIDRSTGGLRIAMTTPIAVGSVLQVRAENAPNTIPWISVVIRSCRDEGKHHEVGCSFEQTPPWNVLLLFG
jgi:hypothetical protein